MKKLIFIILLTHFGLNINAQLLTQKGFMTELPKTSDDFQKYQFDYSLENGTELNNPYYVYSSVSSFDGFNIHPFEHNKPVKSIICELYNSGVNGSASTIVYHSKISFGYGEILSFEGRTAQGQRYAFGIEEWSDIVGRDFSLLPCVPNAYTNLISPTRNSKGLITEVGGELKYVYDSNDRVIEVRYREGIISYRYTYISNSNKIKSVEVSNEERKIGDAFYSYENGMLVGVDCNLFYKTGNEGAVEKHVSKKYEYDERNNLSYLSYTEDNPGDSHTKYEYAIENEYDVQGKITSQKVSRMKTARAGRYTTGSYKEPIVFYRYYKYDSNGNWIEIKTNGHYVIRKIEYDNTIYDKSNPAILKYGAKKYAEQMNLIQAQETSKDLKERKNAALTYAKGNEFINKDSQKAFSIYKELAEGGDMDSYKIISKMYLNGEGVEKDEKKAHEIYIKLSLGNNETKGNIFSGDKDSQDYVLNNIYKIEKYPELIEMISNFYTVENEHNPNQKFGALICKLAGENGNVDAQYEYGIRLYKGDGISKDTIQAKKWIEMAATKGKEEAILGMGQLLYANNDYENAAIWMEKAAVIGNADAQTNIGYLYLNGIGVKKDKKKGIEYIKAAANKYNLEGIKQLYYCYLNGNGVKKDPKAALGCIEMIDKIPNLSQSIKEDEMYYMYGIFFESRGNIEKAIEAYKDSNKKEAKERYNTLKEQMSNKENKSKRSNGLTRFIRIF